MRRVFGPIAASVVRFQPGGELVAGIRSFAAYGHTPGHTAFSIASRGQTFAYLGDLTSIAALFVRNPDWAVRFDMDAEAARQSRYRLLDAAITGNWIVGGYHLPAPGLGHIVRRGAGYDFMPLAWDAADAMDARLAADAVVLLHLAFIAFAMLGGVSVAWRPCIAWLHLPAAAWGAWIEFSGAICPLTPLENHLRRMAGASGYAGGFVERYLIPVIYPAGLTAQAQRWLARSSWRST